MAEAPHGVQTSIRKKLEDAKSERDRSQASEDIRSLRDEIQELRSVSWHRLAPRLYACTVIAVLWLLMESHAAALAARLAYQKQRLGLRPAPPPHCLNSAAFNLQLDTRLLEDLLMKSEERVLTLRYAASWLRTFAGWLIRSRCLALAGL